MTDYPALAAQARDEAEYAYRNGLIDFTHGHLDEIDVELYRARTHARLLFDRCRELEQRLTAYAGGMVRGNTVAQ